MNGNTMPEISTQPSQNPKKNNTKIIIIVGIVVVLCCLCLVLAGVLYYMGTRGNGPLAMLATDTPTPTRTPTPTHTQTNTYTPPLTFTPTLETVIIGDWIVYYSWDCTGSYSSGTLIFYDDYNFNVDYDSSLWGTWFWVGDYVDFKFNEYPNTHYVGTLSFTGDYMGGTMDNLDGMTGCWYSVR